MTPADILSRLPLDRAPTLDELTAAMAPLPTRDIPEVWVFGAFPSGHHLYTVHRQRPGREVWDVERTLDAAENTPRPEQVEGRICRRASPVLAGWSFASWWDRQGDPRTGSHTGILARGEWTDAELIEAGRRLAPWAFRVEVRL